MNLRQLAEERRTRQQQAPTAHPGEQWGKCVGVYQVSPVRKVARILLASGLVVTAYLAANTAAPAVNSDVQVAVASGGPCCKDRPAAHIDVR